MKRQVGVVALLLLACAVHAPASLSTTFERINSLWVTKLPGSTSAALDHRSLRNTGLCTTTNGAWEEHICIECSEKNESADQQPRGCPCKGAATKIAQQLINKHSAKHTASEVQLAADTDTDAGRVAAPSPAALRSFAPAPAPSPPRMLVHPEGAAQRPALSSPVSSSDEVQSPHVTRRTSMDSVLQLRGKGTHQLDSCNDSDAHIHAVDRKQSSWEQVPLQPLVVLGAPYVTTCHTTSMPDSIPSEHEVVGVRVSAGTADASGLQQVAIMECPGDLWFLEDITLAPAMCGAHAADMAAACHLWATGAVNAARFSTSTPPGLVYGRAGDIRSQHRVLVLQTKWKFEPHRHNESMNLQHLAMELLLQTPTGHKTDVVGTLQVQQQAAPSPPKPKAGGRVEINSRSTGSGSVTTEYSCGRRCSYVPLGGLSGQAVNITGFTFEGAACVTGVQLRIQRCPLHHLPDVTWQLSDLGPLALQHISQDVSGAGLLLYPGDMLTMSCTVDAHSTHQAACQPHPECSVQVQYFPRIDMLRGCTAGPAHQGGHSLCMYETTALLYAKDRAQPRAIRAPPALLPLSRQLEPSLGYHTNYVVFWLLFVLVFLWSCSVLLQHGRWLGPVHEIYCQKPLAVQRNIPLYLLHIVVDPVLLVAWLSVLVGGWCGCTETLLTSGRLAGFNLLYIVVAYVIELLWRVKVDPLLAFHHICTVTAIVLLLSVVAVDYHSFGDGVLVYGAFALLEQPTAVALLLQHLLPGGLAQTLRAWKMAVGASCILKAVSLALSACLIVRDWCLMPLWIRATYLAGWLLYCSVQMLTGYTRFSIYCRMFSKAKQLQSCAESSDESSM